MKKIPLTKGQFAIVDDEDYEWLSQFKWYAAWKEKQRCFYARRNSKMKNGKSYMIYMAREILDLKHDDKREGDHIDHNTLDNRRVNLRAVTHQQNIWNQKNISKGYTQGKSHKGFRTRIQVDGRIIHLGYFDTVETAHTTYLQAKERSHEICTSHTNREK